jgi:hypothetical protein
MVEEAAEQHALRSWRAGLFTKKRVLAGAVADTESYTEDPRHLRVSAYQ